MIQRMCGRRLLAVSMLLLLSMVSCVPSQDVGRLAAPYGEDTLRYHLETLGQRLWQRLQSGPEVGLAVDQEVDLVDEYFVLSGQIRRLARELALARDQSDWVMRSLSDQLGWAKHRREVIKRRVEAVISRQVGEALSQAGLLAPIGAQGSGWFFPPSEFFLLKPPFVMVTSPRNRIEINDSYLLASQLSTDTIDALEKQVESETGVSALVEATGGFSLYPAWVAEDDSLSHTLEVVAHEWTHAYLFLFSPLGQAYFEDQHMRTINETVADMVGKEIGREVYRRYYAALESSASQTAASAVRERSFDFARRMRTVRAAVEGMLSLGRVEEAETYMESERRQITDRGVYIRRLNQAYLALHSSYADNPGFESPTGTALAELRSKSASLSDFVRQVASVSSYADFQRLVR